MGEFKTAVEFVLGQSPTPEPTPGGWTPSQTGDLLGIVGVVLFALIAIASLGFFVYSNKKSGVKYGNYISNAGKATLTKSSKIAIAAFMIATLALCSVIFIPSITKAVAANDEADETVKVYVDTEAGTLTSEPTTIVNKTDKNAYIAAVQTTLTPDAEEILKDAKFNLKIESETLGTTLYNKEVPGVDDSIKSLPFAAGQKAQATLTITDLGLDTAKLLAGLNVFTVSFIEAECYVVSYDANGATSGTAPALQTKDPGKDITLAATTDLEKDGYTFEGWNTSADGSGTTYQLGATFSTDADTVLYAYWKENPTPPPPPPADTYRVTFVASTGGIVDAEYIDVDEGTTLVYTPTTGKLELKNQADQSTVKTVIATANTGFVFKQWELDGTAITTEGTINSASKFTAVFDKDIPISDYTITYKVLNTFDAHGSIALNSSNENGAPLVSETVTATHAAVGATASEEDHPEFGYYYFFDGWTIEDEAHSTWSCTDPCLSAEAIAALGLREDTIFIAHFIAPVAKYSEENSTMVFSCDEVIGDGNYTFPVYNSNWDEEFMQSGDFSLLTFPAWCNYDGTQKVYPRTVRFNESFAKYKGLTSTSFWFNTSTITSRRISTSNDEGNNTSPYSSEANLIMEKATLQQSVLTNVYGLENIYTQNLTQTAFMFATSDFLLREISNQNANRLNSLDLSSWNINPKDQQGNPQYVNMRSMFMGCTGLTKLDLPSEEQGHYFGTYANNFTECFYRCSSLQTLTLNGDFGKYATDLTGMFVMCSSLYSIDIGSGFGSAATRCISLFDSCESLLNIKFNPNFCQNATDISHMFYCCLKLTQIDFGTNPKIGQSVRFCNCMFQGCYNLRTIDLSSFVVNEDVSCGDMLNNCGSLESFRISDSWEEPMSYTNLGSVESSEGWYLNYNKGISYDKNQIPEESGSGLFSRMSAKAVYDPKALTFSFYYDCDSHSDDISRGCTVYPVDGNCGFSAGQYGIRSTERNEESKRLSNDKLSALDYATNFTIDALDDLRRPGIMDYRLSGLTLPSWYMIDYNNYKIVNLLKGASKIDVNFTESFQYCPYIYSTSCWFMADSDGYAPFKFDLAYFGRIPTQNIRQTACMFGGFSFEMFKPQNYWYDGSNSEIRYDSSVGVFISPYLDTFNTTLTDLDLSNFNIINSYTDYGAICANCKALTKVTLPSAFIDTKDEDTNNNGSNIAVGQHGEICSFAGAFYGCESLQEITNLSKFNPFTVVNRAGWNFDYYAIGKMFYGCQNLTSLDLGLFNTNYIIGSRGSKSFSAYNVFTGCNKLTSITIGSNWYIPMGSEYANLPSLEDFGIRWQKNGEGYSTDSIPYYKSHDEPDNYGTFTRDPEEIERLRQTVSISSEDPSKGTVSSGSYMFYPNKPVCVNGSDNLIRLNDTTIIATPKEGYKFDYWTVGGWYYDNEECSFAKSFEIVAHFSPDGYSAKAVYTKNNSAYDNDNTLTFYYDNVDHSSEGTVYEVIPNTRADTYKGNAVLPSWFQTTYVAKADMGQVSSRTVISREELERRMRQSSALYYNPYSSSSTATTTTYSNLWKIQTLIEPKDVIFAENFKNFTNLSSISMWFMADQFGTQTVENFYSPTSSNPKNPGFANLYTSNLMDVKYAFGGLFEEDVAEDTVQEMLLDGVINMVDAVTSPANKDDENVEWSKSTETYGTSISTLDLTGFDFSHVPYLKAMFANCVGLKTIKFGSNLNTENLYDCNAMFVNCENLGPIFRDCVENWNKFTTTRVEDFDYMFYGCSGIEELDISNLSTENAYTWKRSIAAALESNGWNADDASGYKVFSECTRLSKIKINSYYDENKPASVGGWNLNLGLSGLADCNGEGKWINEDSVNWDPTPESNEIPYDIDVYRTRGYLEENEIYTGTFYRSNKFLEKSVNIESNDDVLGKVSDSKYGYINDVQIKADNVNDNVIYVDNRKITAIPEEGARFAYWQIAIGDSEPEAIPAGYNQTFSALDDYKINITAVFISNETNGYVAFSVNDSREGTFTFYYGVGTEAAASKYVPSGEKLISVFDVKSNTSDYDLPSWYRKYQESWHENDNHPIPKFVKVIEDNVDNNKLYVRFDKTFTEFKELRSMSCWFMGALSHIDESVLFNPFNLDSADHFAGLENIDTGNISNVAYMFGGHEYFNDLHGSKNTKIYLENFDVKGNIKNLSGLFANLPKLTELYVGDKCFYGMKNVYSTSKMFYNTPLLEKAELNWLNTQEVSEMEYMFGNTVEQIPSEAALDVSKLILPSNFVITEKVKSLEGIFCGYADCKEFEVKFDKCKSSSSFNQIENMSYMFQNCCHATRISVSGTNNLTSASVTNMSHMYENCTKINSVTSQDEQIPTELTMINAVTDFSYMFAGCSSLNRYSLMRETSPAYLIQSAAYMFSDCPNLKDVEFAGNYNWFYVDDFDNYYRSTGAVNMFANLDGTLNSTLEHFTYDTNAWNSAISFAAAGLAYVNGNNPIGWINSKSMYYDISTRMPDIVPVPSTNDINMVTFDRMTTNYYFKLSSNSAGFAYGEWDDKISIATYMLPFIGVAGGYSITVNLGPVEKYWNNSQEINFVLTNTSKGLSRTYTLIGNAYDDFNPEWYYETIQSHQTGQITTGSDLPDEDSIIWFFNIPGQEQQRQVDDCVAEAQAVEAAAVDEVAVADEAMPAAEIAIEAVSAFVLPIPVTLVNIALSLIW